MENLTYDEFINNILETRGRFACGEEYHERHHIIPRCCDGTDEECNLIDLFAKEHYEAHRLLALENPDNTKLVYAWWCVSTMVNKNTKERLKIAAEEYEEARIILSKTRSENQKRRFEDPAERIKNGEYTKKRYENIEEHIKQSETMKKKYKDPEMRKKTGVASKKMWQNEEYRQKQIEIAKRISQNPEIIQARSDGSKKRWSNPDAHKHHSDRMNGENNPRAKQVVRLSDGFIYGCIKDAVIDVNVSRNTLCNYCKQHKGFMYYDEWLTVQNDLGDDDSEIQIN